MKKTNKMKKVGVIGAGIMGSDVALNLSCYGYNVILVDVSLDILDKAKEKIIKDFRMVKMMKPDLKSLTNDEILKKINFTSNYEALIDADIIIENVSEDWEIKERVYKELINICKKDALYFVNTSCISITKVASLHPQPEKVIGMHFMNPVPLKELVEVVKGYHTSEDTINNSKEFLKSIKKIPVVVNDFPGFVANRLSHLFMNEAAFLIQDNVASPKEVDIIFKKGYGHTMGPLETADLIGLDTVVNSLEILYNNYQDSKFRCCPLLRKMVDAGLLGKKSGEGFYNY
jgi:3-hydroxybutyryl-CoA dehydrogenase